MIKMLVMGEVKLYFMRKEVIILRDRKKRRWNK
jgi:hypothetical protein